MNSSIKRKQEVLTYLRSVSYPVLHYPKYKCYRAFFESGDRQSFELDYFNKRKELTRLGLINMLDTSCDEEKEDLENLIFSICQEFTWCLPAHVDSKREENPKKRNYTIDLFASETAFTLAELVSLLSPNLDSTLRQLVYQTINERIFEPFLNECWGFEELDNNWSSVCCGSIGMAALYLMPDTTKRQQILTRVEEAMSIFISGFGQDGASREGVSYWQYGFRYFTYFADHYKKVTNGKKDLFSWPTILNVARFQQKVFAYDRVIFNYSDAPDELEQAHDLAFFYYQLFGSQIKRPDHEYKLDCLIDHCGRFAPAHRTLIWSDQPESKETAITEQHHLKDAGIYIYKSKNLHFLAKGGDNDEAHNHNDLGHFILHLNKKPVFIDLGAPLYTRDYFSDGRYQVIQASSRGHSVPLINNNEQKSGPEHRAPLIVNDQLLTFDLTSAYTESNLAALIREIDLSPDNNQITITDRIRINDRQQHVTRRFILADCSLEKKDDHVIKLENQEDALTLCFSPNHHTYQWERIAYVNHQGEEVYAIILDVSRTQVEEEANYHLMVKWDN